MSKSLPLRANLEWLKKAAKERLDALRAENPAAQLADAQFALAREYGFASWPKLSEHVEMLQSKLAEFAAGADPNAPPVAPDDPDLAQLFAAIQSGDAKIVSDLLTERRELAKARDAHGQTPLHAAAEHDDPRLCAFLLVCGADPNAKFGDSGHTALSWAVTCNASHAAAALVRLGGKTDLFCAAGMGDVDAVRSFFDENGALRPNASRTGSSRLGPDGARLPCPPATPVEQISDALYIAARNAHTECVRFLLTKNPDLSFRAYMGATPLHWAHFAGARDCIKLLEEAGADRNARDDSLHCTPRAFAIIVPASWGFAEFVARRLNEDPTLATLVDGTSALHEAAARGYTGIIRMLLAAGADPMVRNADGRTPAELAVQHGHQDVVAMLK